MLAQKNLPFNLESQTNPSNSARVQLELSSLTNATAEIVLVDTEQAEYWLKYCGYERQRKLNREHMLFLASEMTKGKFNPGTSIAFAQYNDSLYLINGQHSLSAIVYAKRSQNLNVIKIKVENQEQIAEMYANFDIGISRSIADMLRAHALEQDIGLPESVQSRLGSAVNLLANKFRQGKNRKNSRSEILFGVRYWAPYARKYFSVVHQKNNPLAKRLLSASCFAMGLIMFKYNEKRAQDFWFQVCNGATSNKKPTNHLRTYLLMTNQTTANTYKIKGRAAGLMHTIYYITAAWNAFVDKRDLTFIKTDHLENNFHIRCVPDLDEVYNVTHKSQ